MGMRARAMMLAAALAAALPLLGCNRESRDLQPIPATETGPKSVSLSDLYPGPFPSPTPSDPRGDAYQGNAFHISNGQRDFEWFNCSGCHFHGGGGIGPALMDEKWRYGGKIEQIYASIAQGRPNGMPSFKDRIPEQEIWELAAYVRALSANADKLAVPSREDAMRGPPPLNNLDREPIKGDPAAAKAGGG